MRMPSPARRNFLALVRFSAEIADPYMLGSALSEKPDVDVKRVGQQQHFVMASLTLLYVDSRGVPIRRASFDRARRVNAPVAA
jgi:hypothetical protein